MRFVCEKSVLLSVLTDLIRSVAVRSNVAILEGIHITVKGLKVELESYNMEFGIQTKILVVEAQDGSIVVPAKIFSDIIKKLPDGLVEMKTNKFEAEIVSKNCKFVISCFDPNDFPKLPFIENEKFIELPSNTIKNMIQQTIFAVRPENEEYNIHTGTLIEAKDNFLVFVSVDGFRMALRRESINISENFKIVVPGKTLRELLRLIPDDKVNIKIYLSERYIFFKLDNYLFLSSLLEGEFIDYNSTIPEENSTRIKVKVNELIFSVERVSLVIQDRLKSPVRAIIGPDCIKFSCSTTLGKSEDTLNANVKGEPLEIAFNDRFMIDAFKNVDADEVLIETSAFKPLKIIPLEGDSFLFLVLPVRFHEEN
ncbi:MAG: DNA polymerase III subunit beta [Oscillospiraceae bacterium]|jgi:DNA polymerase-3 subunit beta|nr:DNA polymerase III subunit beta [Oscillospiraceae bacterium]